MPTVLRVGPYRFFFWPGEGHEPAHIHVQRDNNYAKFWLEPVVRLADWDGFKRPELRRVERIVEERRDELRERWHGFYSGGQPGSRSSSD